MHVVMTRVKLQPGTSQKCADLFQQSNPALVENQQDWQGARMVFDSETNIVTVLATWRDRKSYDAMASSPEFQDTMAQFRQFFASAPEVSVNEVLVDMAP